MKTRVNDGVMTLSLTGHIDSNNAPKVEREMLDAAAAASFDTLIADAAALEYISSAGLRIMLRIKKTYPDFRIINVSSAVYEVFEMTGFTEIIDISRALREVSIEGCEIIGEGANGKVYRLDSDTIVKVYRDGASIDEIQHERELARTAFVLGIPTAIAYDVVKVGDSYGAVFELLNAKNLAKLIIENQDNLEYVAVKSVEIAKIIHSTLAPVSLPDEFDVIFAWLEQIRDFLAPEEYEKFRLLVDSLPRDGMMIHGDYHIKNLMQQNDEVLLIDMDTLSKGHAIFELGFMFNAYKGFGVVDPGVIERFLGFDSDTAYRLWRRMLALYIGTEDAAALDETEDKAALIGYLRLMRREMNKGNMDTDAGRTFISAVCGKIKDLLMRVNTLEFRIYE